MQVFPLSVVAKVARPVRIWLNKLCLNNLQHRKPVGSFIVQRFKNTSIALRSACCCFFQLLKHFQVWSCSYVTMNSQLHPGNLPTKKAMQFKFCAVIPKSIPLYIQRNFLGQIAESRCEGFSTLQGLSTSPWNVGKPHLDVAVCPRIFHCFLSSRKIQVLSQCVNDQRDAQFL